MKLSLRSVRHYAVILVAIVAGFFALLHSSSAVQAPLMTMIGGTTVLLMILPVRNRGIVEQMQMALGTSATVFGAIFWLESATGGLSQDPYAWSIAIPVLAVLVFWIWGSAFYLAWQERNKDGEDTS